MSSYGNKDSTTNSHVASLKLTVSVSTEYSYHTQDFFLLWIKSVRRQRLKLLSLPSLSLPSPQLLSMQFGSNLVHYKSVQLISSPEQNWMKYTESPKGDKSFSRMHFIWISLQLLVLVYQIATVLRCKPADAYSCFWTLQLRVHRIQNTKKLPPPGLTGFQSDTGKYLSLRNESNTTYNLYYL